MGWMKASDIAHEHEVVRKIANLYGSDPRMVNEFRGYALALYCETGKHTSDYWVDEATCRTQAGPGRFDDLDTACRRVGLYKPKTAKGVPGRLLMVDQEFLTVRLRGELEWEKQQKADAADGALTVPVRLRDGDGCRYCGSIVQWRARRGNRRGTYDHREPGKPATIDTYVVACGGCNSARRDRPDAEQIRPLRPPPRVPFYGETTVGFLALHGVTVALTPGVPALEPAVRPAADLQVSAETTRSPADRQPDSRDGTGTPGQVGPERPGSGQVGPGQVEVGRPRSSRSRGRRRPDRPAGEPSAVA